MKKKIIYRSYNQRYHKWDDNNNMELYEQLKKSINNQYIVVQADIHLSLAPYFFDCAVLTKFKREFC